MCVNYQQITYKTSNREKIYYAGVLIWYGETMNMWYLLLSEMN